jgi:hypothetical protein
VTKTAYRSNCFKQTIKAGEVGSIDTWGEQSISDAEDNLGIINAISEHFAAKLPISISAQNSADSTLRKPVPARPRPRALETLRRGPDEAGLDGIGLRRVIRIIALGRGSRPSNVLRRLPETPTMRSRPSPTGEGHFEQHPGVIETLCVREAVKADWHHACNYRGAVPWGGTACMPLLRNDGATNSCGCNAHLPLRERDASAATNR